MLVKLNPKPFNKKVRNQRRGDASPNLYKTINNKIQAIDSRLSKSPNDSMTVAKRFFGGRSSSSGSGAKYVTSVEQRDQHRHDLIRQTPAEMIGQH